MNLSLHNVKGIEVKTDYFPPSNLRAGFHRCRIDIRMESGETFSVHLFGERAENFAGLHAQKQERAQLVAALRELMLRCDGDEGVRADGSNIQTMAASALLQKLGEL